MKKLLFLLPIVMLSLLMSSCKGDDGPMGPIGPMGPAGPGGVGYYKQGPMNAPTSAWSDQGEFYEAYFEIPDLDKWVYKEGVVNVFIVLGDTKRPLNLDLPQEDQNGLYNEEYKFSYSEGSITLELSYSDGIMRKPGDLEFYFVLQSLD